MYVTVLTSYCLLLHCFFALTCWKATVANELEATTWYSAPNSDIDDSAAGYCPFAPQKRKKERKKGTVWIRAIYLPCGCVSPEIGKLSCKPVVDLIESQLSVWGLQNGLRTGRDTIR